jgi:hypothetical protein
MTLSQKHLEDVCLVRCSDKSKICRYLRNDELDSSKWYCQKLHEFSRNKIDSETETAMARNARGIPFGDNCEGYHVFKHIVQGYDVD